LKEIDEARIENIEHLNKVTILTEDDWTKFKNLFEQVYKGFFIRLKEKLPDLTQSEVRLVCLTKLNLDTKQMAGILGVSFATIRQSRYRMRKKLGLSEEGGIEDIIESI
jgi:DNA-binding CsgD family transcriptional regulator